MISETRFLRPGPCSIYLILIPYHRLGLTEAQLLDNYPTLSTEDLANAWAYAETYPDEIEAAIQKHNEA